MILKRQNILLLIFIEVIISLYSCQSNRSFIAFDEQEDISSFPVAESLHNSKAKKLLTGLHGLVSLMVRDSLMWLSTMDSNGLLSIYSMPQEKVIGQLFPIGHGENEFTGFLFVEELKWRNFKDSLFLGWETPTGDINWCNISNFFNTKTLHSIKQETGVPKDSQFIYEIGENCFFYKNFDLNSLCIIRGIQCGAENIRNENLDILNASSLIDDDNYPLLASIVSYCPEQRLLVEAPLRLPHLNLFSIDTNFRKTLKLNPHKENKPSQNTNLSPDQYFHTIRCYPNFWVVLSSELLTIEDKPTPHLLFFDWEGHALASLSLPIPADNFDLDLKCSQLYLIDKTEDEILYYDVQDFIDKITKLPSFY